MTDEDPNINLKKNVGVGVGVGVGAGVDVPPDPPPPLARGGGGDRAPGGSGKRARGNATVHRDESDEESDEESDYEKEYEDEDDGDNNNPNNSTAPRPPPYNGIALAREVFSHPYFYNDNGGVAGYCRGLREAAFVPTLTVDDVHRQYYVEEGGGGSTRLMQLTAGTNIRFDAYFAGASSLEDLLARQKVVSLDPSDQVKVFNARRVRGGVPSSAGVYEALAATDHRTYRLCFVMGSSGSGKTFFALQHLREFLNVDKDLRSVTLYLRAGTYVGEGYVDYGNADAPSKFVEQLRDSLHGFIKDWLKRDWDRSTPLQMHVCIVVDEAGSSATQGYFDNRVKVLELLKKLRSSGLAKSLNLVVCGTGLQSQTFSSDKEAYYFRMRPWTQDDLEKILHKYSARPKEWPRQIAKAVSNISLLDALSTNGRSAYFMVRGIVKATKQTSELSYLGMEAHLSALVPEIVNSVVFRYIDSNGIKLLDEDQRRRIAAWLLGALSELKSDDVTIPDFPGLGPFEVNAAMQLIQLNVQKSGGTIGFVPGEAFSISVTPALAIVLYNMAGVFTNLVSGWRGEEEIAALYAAKQAILERWSTHAKAVRDMQRGFVQERDEMDLAKFLTALHDQGRDAKARHETRRRELEAEFLGALKQVKVYRLQRQLQSSKKAPVNSPIDRLQRQRQSSKKAPVNIPIVSRHSILINGDRASFAKVIAPYTFYQTKHTSTPQEKSLDVNLAAELNKCCLLTEGTRSGRVVRGLRALWDGSLADMMGTSANAHETATVNMEGGHRAFQASRAYPENLIKCQKVPDGVRYAEILDDMSIKGTNSALPDSPDNRSITFVLSTNAESLCLILSEDEEQKKTKKLTITKESLDGDMQVDPATLSIEDEGLWKAFLRELVREAQLTFLFTGSRR